MPPELITENWESMVPARRHDYIARSERRVNYESCVLEQSAYREEVRQAESEEQLLERLNVEIDRWREVPRSATIAETIRRLQDVAAKIIQLKAERTLAPIERSIRDNRAKADELLSRLGK